VTNEPLQQSFTAGGVAARPVTVRPARRSEANQLIDALTESFSDSALFDWLVLQDSEADRRRRLVFEAFVDILGFGHGEVWTTDDHAGVAIWHQPGQWRMEFADLLRFLPLFVKAAGYATSWQKLIGLNKLGRRHPRYPHFYLLSLGVIPSRQEQGCARALLRPLLKRCDERRCPAYLETANERNIAVYERYGFELQETFDLPFGGPTIWTMRRYTADSRPQPSSMAGQ